MTAIAANGARPEEARLFREGSPFELHEIVIGTRRCIAFRNGPQTVVDILRKAQRLGKSTLAVQGGTRLSYGDAFQRAAHLATGLREDFGAIPGTRVAIGLENGADWIVAFLAVVSLGATAVLVDAANLEAASDCCRLADCSILIARSAPASPAFVGRPGAPARQVPIESLLRDAPMRDYPAAVCADDEAIVAFTSGSTGAPKGAILTHRGVVTGLTNMMLAGAFAGAGTVRAARRPALPCALMLAPLSHIAGYAQLLLMLLLGGKLVFPQRIAADEILQLVEREKATALVGASPRLIREMLRTPPHDIASLAAININGIALHAKLAEDIAARWRDVIVGTGYGMTETNGSVCAIAGAELQKHQRSCGRLVPTVECRIVDEAGHEAAPGATGEIRLRGAMLMRGYCGGVPDALDDGWLKTGDIGYVCPERYLYLVDRRDEDVAAIGDISCFDVERRAIAHADLDEAVALGAVDGEGRRILLVAIAAAREVDCRRLADALSAGLPLGDARLRVVQLAEFPRTRSGKVDRKILKSQLNIGRRG